MPGQQVSSAPHSVARDMVLLATTLATGASVVLAPPRRRTAVVPPPPRRPKRTPRGQPPSRARSALARRRDLDLPIRAARRRLGTMRRETWRGRRRETWRRSDATSASAPACASATTATSQTDGGLRTSARPSANDPGTYQSKIGGFMGIGEFIFISVRVWAT